MKRGQAGFKFFETGKKRMPDTSPVKISKVFAPDSAVDPYDTRQIKQALNRLGYYRPLPSTGITNIPDRAVFDSIKLFQNSSNLPATEYTLHLAHQIGPQSPSHVCRT